MLVQLIFTVALFVLCRNYPITEIWTSNWIYMSILATATMSRNRFVDIRKFLRYDNKEERDQAEAEGTPKTRISLITEIFNPFVKYLQEFYIPGNFLTVDEMLLRFRGRTSFRIYMKSKPGKYGIKIWVIVDHETG